MPKGNRLLLPLFPPLIREGDAFPLIIPAVVLRKEGSAKANSNPWYADIDGMNPFRTVISTIILLSLTLFQLSGAEPVAAETDRFRGPLRSRNQFPPLLMYLNPVPASPATLPERVFLVSPAVDYSSVYVDQGSGNWDVLIDMELMVVDLTMAYGVTRNLTLSF